MINILTNPIIEFSIECTKLKKYLDIDTFRLVYRCDWDISPNDIIDKRYEITKMYIDIFENFNKKLEYLYGNKTTKDNQPIHIKLCPSIIEQFIESIIDMYDYNDLDELFEEPIEENIYNYIINPIPSNLNNCCDVDYTYNHKLSDAANFAKILYKLEQNLVAKLGITDLDKNRFTVSTCANKIPNIDSSVNDKILQYFLQEYNKDLEDKIDITKAFE